MTRRLAQPQQAFEDEHARAAEAFAIDAVHDRFAERHAQLIVVVALRPFELTVDGLLDLRRQVGRHLRLGAAQQERTERLRQDAPALRIAVRLVQLVERLRRSEQARIEEVEQAPQLAEMVLHGRAGQREPLPSAQQPHRARRLRTRVLDRVRLVEDDAVEGEVGEPGGIAEERAVGREHEVPPQLASDSGSRARFGPV